MSLKDFKTKILSAMLSVPQGSLPTEHADRIAESFCPPRSPGFLLDRIEQVAMYTPSIASAKADYARLGLTNWVDDTVTGMARVQDPNQPIGTMEFGPNMAQLAFNYDLGFELELITYLSGPNWHRAAGRIDYFGECENNFASHMSWHVEDIEAASEPILAAGFPLAQTVTTIAHTNPYLMKNWRKFKYAVFDTRSLLGWDIKLIQRIEARK